MTATVALEDGDVNQPKSADDDLVAMRKELATLQAEKKELLDNSNKLRRQNEELERVISLQRRSNASETQTSNGRSKSALSRLVTGHDGEVERYSNRIKAFARWASPHPRVSGDDDRSCSSTINTEDVIQTVKKAGEADCHASVIATLKEQLRDAENRANVLQQRLQIVKESGDSVIKSLNEELAEVAEEASKSEAAMIQELARLNAQRRVERADFEKKIEEWIALDASRKLEIEEYQRRIESLLDTVRLMDITTESHNLIHCNSSSSLDKEAEEEMHKDLLAYVNILNGENSGKRGNPLVASINVAFDLKFNANPIVGDELIEYYRSHAELKEFTLKSELPRMDYEVLVADAKTKEGKKLVTPEEIRDYFEGTNIDEESELCIRSANQSLLADPLSMLTGDGSGKIVHSGSFYSTVIANSCTFKIDLRHEGERRVKIYCELAICVPSGDESTEDIEEANATSSTLELARANLVIQFGPSALATPSGPLIKYTLSSITPSLTTSTEDAQALVLAAAALAKDRNTHIRKVENPAPDSRPNSRRTRFLAKVKQYSQSN